VFALDQTGLKRQISTNLKRFSLQTMEWKAWADRPLRAVTYDQAMKAMELGREPKRRFGIGWGTRWIGISGTPIMSKVKLNLSRLSS
jgi:hypothetical protein